MKSGAPIIEDWVSDSEDELDESTPRSTQSSDLSKNDTRPRQCAKKEEIPQFTKPKFNQNKFVKPALGRALSKRIVEYHETPRDHMKRFNNKPRGNQRSFNGLVSHKLGNDFHLKRKACYNCGSFEHLQANCANYQNPVWNQYTRVNHQNFTKRDHSPPKRNVVPRAVLLRSGATRSIVTAQPKRHFQNKTTGSTAKVNSAVKAIHSTAVSKKLPNTVVGNHFYAVKA